MISESGSVEALMLRSSGFQSFGPSMDHSKLDRLDPMQNQLCRVCEEPAAGFHFGAFTCEGCKSFFGRTCNNQSVIQECKNNYRCVVDKKNRTACKACRLRKCIMVGMSKSGSRYGRRSNWFKIHCLMQQNLGGGSPSGPSASPGAKASPSGSTSSSSASTSSISPTDPALGPIPTPPSQLGLWSSPPKRDMLSSPELPHRPVDHLSLGGVSPPRSPEGPPTMVPRTSITDTSGTPSPSSPYKNFLPALSPLGLPPHPATVSTTKPELSAAPAMPSPLSPPNMTAASASLYPGFPFMGAPGFPGIPFHKQALLSPLLAQSHLFQMAAASASARHNPLFSGLRPPQPPTEPTDVMAEHKALLERFASSMAAMAAVNQQQQQQQAQAAAASSPEPAKSVSPHVTVKEEKEDLSAQNCPMDLSSKKDDDSGSEAEEQKEKVEVTSSSPLQLSHSAASLLKADLNRNLASVETREKVLGLFSKTA